MKPNKYIWCYEILDAEVGKALVKDFKSSLKYCINFSDSWITNKFWYVMSLP
jgi:hypothetical protein